MVSGNVVLDVKTGSGAFMKTLEDSTALAKEMVEIGNGAGRKTVAIISDMDQPLGYAVGNALEVKEAIAVLNGEETGDLLQLCLALGGCMLTEAGFASTQSEAEQMLLHEIRNGNALKKLAEMVHAQGGDESAVFNPQLLPQAPVVRRVPAPVSGFVSRIHAEAVGLISMKLGGGRATKEDRIDPAVGVVLAKKVGDAVSAGDLLGEIHAADAAHAEEAEQQLLSCYEFRDGPVVRPPFIRKILRGENGT